jgi:hypothetical protein
MATLEFFNNKEENEFFDEGPKVQSAKIIVIGSEFHNSSSINTTLLDPYRQGVELTQQKHFDRGTFKIHAGEQGHKLKRNHFGMTNSFNTVPQFTERDYFNPENYLRSTRTNSPVLSNVITFPMITSSDTSIEGYMFDGVIEPLNIRMNVSNLSTAVSLHDHEVKGHVIDGNTDFHGRTDKIVSVYIRNLTQQPGFVDRHSSAETFLSDPTTYDRNVLSNIGYSYSITSRLSLKPYVDNRFVRNTEVSSYTDSTMQATLSHMTGSTDNYIAIVNNERSATCGWDYDNNIIGTDSLAFGGMSY